MGMCLAHHKDHTLALEDPICSEEDSVVVDSLSLEVSDDESVDVRSSSLHSIQIAVGAQCQGGR